MFSIGLITVLLILVTKNPIIVIIHVFIATDRSQTFLNVLRANLTIISTYNTVITVIKGNSRKNENLEFELITYKYILINKV